ncbi:MAG: YgiT-type zinc finger protein [Chloroflexi bacterium]|nr:YgiT-type zinc finger protein [Chloroflexota bacterium]
MNAISQPTVCPRCQCTVRPAQVRTDIWQNDHLYVVEDVPAFICDGCQEQFYDDDVTDALRRLNEDGFLSTVPSREILVPVYSLAGQIKRVRSN